MREDVGGRREERSLTALCGLDDPVRGGLYAYVSGRDEPVGRDEAAAATGIGRPLAAYHLDKLVEAGLLTASYRRLAGRRGPGAGRPAKFYACSGREFAVSVPPREYELAAGLLVLAVTADESGAARTALLQAARRLGSDIGHASAGADSGGRGSACRDSGGRDSAGRDSPGPERAVQAALAAHGFEPVRGRDGTVRLRNCPFHQLATAHPEVVCAMNLALLEGVVEGAGAAGVTPELDPAPGHCCVVIRTGRPDQPSITGAS